MFPVELYEVALQKEFSLSYHSTMGSVAEWQGLPVGERDWHYNKLADQKAEEKRQNDEESAKMKAKSRSRH